VAILASQPNFFWASQPILFINLRDMGYEIFKKTHLYACLSWNR
jgi:hypothetical protein